jgi:AraC family transcriptional regulator
MDTVQKALWYVETHSCQALTLEQVASAIQVSPYHLTRAFAAVMGTPLMRYVRRRRLSEAARQLAAGATDIMAVAIDHGYGSHEAFSRAFKEEFRVTPESVRLQGHHNNLALTEPIAMSATPAPQLGSPRIETLSPKRLAGIVERYDCESTAGFPKQWQRFASYLGHIAKQIGRDVYGVSYNFDDEGKFDYLSGAEVRDHTELPFGLVQLDLPEQKYAVFSYGGHVAEIRAVLATIWSEALPGSGCEAAQGPTLEKFGDQLDPATGLGRFEIWIAVQ